MKSMRIFYWNSTQNFGDLLGVPLLKHYAKVSATFARPEEADIVVCGSILRLLPSGWKGIVLGTGSIARGNFPDLSKATVLAVRGPRTAHLLKRSGLVLGDPGVLAPGLLESLPKKTRPLLIVPHWSDDSLALRYRDTPVVNVRTTNVVRIVREIASAEQVVTSSLHGLLVAWSFGIPTKVFPHERTDIEGGTWKWEDALTPLGVRHVWGGKFREAPMQAIEDMQGNLRSAFAQLRELIA
jgi:pyruvyltransferase